MCGILGIIGPDGISAAPDASPFRRALALLDHRGPDGQATWGHGNVALGHTRLAVRDPHSELGLQPIVSPCGRYALVYNGEIYNDSAVRSRIRSEVEACSGGAGFRSSCDAETMLWALAIEGLSALDRIRGMYAFAFVDTQLGLCWLGRDSLGIKPLVYRSTESGGFAFASETRALLALPGVPTAVDPEMIATYLATSRRTAFGRTLFEGVRCVLPGEVLRIDLRHPERGPRPVASGGRFAAQVAGLAGADNGADDGLDNRLFRAVTDSVESHLIADVPLCGLLSGGLDSAIITSIAAARTGRLATWCASGVEDGEEIGGDPAAARLVSEKFGTDHHAVSVDRATYLREWRAHVEHLGAPLSTPNEIAIAEISRAIRSSGKVVALSGEGADELFGGYGSVLAAFAAHGDLTSSEITPGRLHLEVCAWVSPAAQDEILRPEFAGSTEFLVDAMEAQFAAENLAAGPRGSHLEAHLRMQRGTNLTALLERLDAATMRHGIEGRTPFADQRVRALADALPMDQKFRVDLDSTAPMESKIALRRAFAGVLPEEIVQRPKASFPLPFDRWSSPVTTRLTSSPLLLEFVERDALAEVTRHPAEHWKLGWLFGNLALFGEAVLGLQPERPLVGAASVS